MALPTTEAAEGVGVDDCWVCAGPTDAGSTPTPKANEPADAWPSADETTVQETVYTPSGRSAGSGTASERGASPPTAGPDCIS